METPFPPGKSNFSLFVSFPMCRSDGIPGRCVVLLKLADIGKLQTKFFRRNSRKIYVNEETGNCDRFRMARLDSGLRVPCQFL